MSVADGAGQDDSGAVADNPLAGGARAPDFFQQHEWCLNPIQTIEELRARAAQCWELLGQSEPGWQQQECSVNLYLLLCALSCAAEDYLCYRPRRVAAPGMRQSRLGRALAAGRRATNLPYLAVSALARRRVRVWNAALAGAVKHVCEVLVCLSEGAEPRWSTLAAELPALLAADLPALPRTWRMRVPESYRCQDMTHHDVIQMAHNFLQASAAAPPRPVLVVGPRTAGSYFVPLVCATLLRHNRDVRAGLTIRPKEGLSGAERKLLSRASRSGWQVVIVDDHPNTGNTFRLIVGLLRRLGGRPENLVILAPDHAAQTDWIPSLAPVPVIELKPEQFYKARLLRNDARLLEWIAEFRGLKSAASLAIASNPAVDEVNAGLEGHYGDSFQVRQKRLFEVIEASPAGGATTIRVLAKSVGWGWLGYHAALAGQRLAGHVPEVLGVRDGLMFMLWHGALASVAPRPEQVAERVPGYIAARARSLRLPHDATVDALGYRVTGRDRILQVLRQPYGRFLKHLGRGALDRRHGDFVPPRPALIDGKMGLENWVADGAELRKVDFEHHNFGGAEEDIVDPAYDLAGALFELDLDRAAEDRLLAEYIELSADAGVGQRLILHKLRIGLRALARAADALELPLTLAEHRVANLRFLAARSFLNRQICHHQAGRIDVPARPSWSERLFSLDLDGVIDSQVLGYFPHTTPAGLGALRLLQEHGYSIVVNSGRGTADVRLFCETYGLPGGFAEYGAVWIDRVAGREEVLTDAATAAELVRCSELIAQCKGVFTDPGYRSAVRAFRYEGPRWVGLGHAEIEEVFAAGRFEHLEAIETSASTYIVPKGIDKGTALAGLGARLGLPRTWLAAIGDSDQDVPMLQRADLGFVVANGSQAMRSLAASAAHVRLMTEPEQRGLLAAVVELLEQQDGIAAGNAYPRARALVRESYLHLDVALGAYDLTPLERWLSVFRPASRKPLR